MQLIKRFLLATALALAALPAWAGDLRLVITNGTPATVGGKAMPAGTLTVDRPATSDADIARFAAWAMDAYPKFDTGSKDGNGNEIFTASTPAQAVTMALQGVITGLVNNVLVFERSEAAETAAGAVNPINPQ